MTWVTRSLHSLVSKIVQVNPAAISALGLSLEDVRTTLGQANVNAPKGSFEGPRQSFTIGSNDQIFSADAYKPIIVAYKNGAPTGRPSGRP